MSSNNLADSILKNGETFYRLLQYLRSLELQSFKLVFLLSKLSFMKRLTIFLFVAFTFMLESCSLGSLSNIQDSSVKVIKCCKNVSPNIGSPFVGANEKEATENKTPCLLPVYIWDYKQMLW